MLFSSSDHFLHQGSFLSSPLVKMENFVDILDTIVIKVKHTLTSHVATTVFIYMYDCHTALKLEDI